MRALWIVLIFTTNVLLASQSPDRCEKTAHTLHDLQNRIVSESFRALKAGEWARYSDGSVALALGRRVASGGTLYGVEIQSRKIPPIQVWYAVVDKSVPTRFGKMRFRTVEPREVYIRNGGMVILLEGKGLQSIFRQYAGTDLILTPDKIRTMIDCSHQTRTVLQPRYRLSKGRTVEAVKIVEGASGRAAVVSPQVPFGFVEVPGKSPLLADFGQGGIRPVIDRNARQTAFSVNFLQTGR